MKFGSILVMTTASLSFLATAQAAVTARTLVASISDISASPKVKLSSELQDFFNKNGCALPEKLKEKLTVDIKNGLIPADLRISLGAQFDTDVFKIPNKSINNVLHFAEYKTASATAPVRIDLKGANTYNALNPMAVIDRQFSNYAYTMDCSGFLNASIATGGGVKAAQAEAAAKSALESQKSMLTVRALLNSPVAMAINPDLFSGTQLGRTDRIELLYSMIVETLGSLPGAADDTTVTSWRQVEVLWTSNQGSSSFQGKASFNASGNAAMGVFTSSSDVNSGAVVGRNISFTNFDTYVIDSSLTPVQTTLKNLYETTANLVNNTGASATRKLDATYLVSFELPRLVCSKAWSMNNADGSAAVNGNVNAAWDGKACNFTLAPASPIASSDRFIQLRAAAGYKNVVFALPVLVN